MLTGTSGEYLGRRPLPRALRERPVVVVCGPLGVGKSSVARAIAGDKARSLDDRGLHAAMVWRIRQSRWSKALLTVPALVIDGPVFLADRPGAAATVVELIRLRVEAGLHTVLVEGLLADGSLGLLMDAVPPEQRATLTLRFPVAGGRLRFAQRVCDELDLPRGHARAVQKLHPWSYRAVRSALLALASGEQPG